MVACSSLADSGISFAAAQQFVEPAAQDQPYLPPWQATRHQFALVSSFGFGGSAWVESGYAASYQNLDTTYGVTARLLFAASPYFAIGPSLGSMFWRTYVNSYFGSRSILLNIDLNLKLRFPFALGSRSAAEVYVTMPGGLSVSFPQSAFEPLDTGLGWNLGILGGATFFVRGGFGLLLELGWMRHQVWHYTDQFYYSGSYVIYTNQVQSVLNQFTLQTGVVVLF